ncbi:MAG: choice-of-anchor D domain-containing protein [Phycisphaerae bacterium]|nr:choice-of-anchor D domain-containing protein [Phycisphaerae bacterium]
MAVKLASRAMNRLRELYGNILNNCRLKNQQNFSYLDRLRQKSVVPLLEQLEPRLMLSGSPGMDWFKVDGDDISNSGGNYGGSKIVAPNRDVWVESMWSNTGDDNYGHGGITLSFPGYQYPSSLGVSPSSDFEYDFGSYGTTEAFYRQKGDTIASSSGSTTASYILFEGDDTEWDGNDWSNDEEHTIRVRINTGSSSARIQANVRGTMTDDYWQNAIRNPYGSYGVADSQQGWRVYPYYIYVDATGPYAPGGLDMVDSYDTGLSSDDEITKESRPEFEWNAPSDQGYDSSHVAGVDKYYWEVTREGGSTPLDYDYTSSTSDRINDSLSNGDYTFHVWAIDNFGNWGSKAAIDFTIDTSRPSSPTPSEPSGDISTLTPDIAWSYNSSYDWKYDVDLEYKTVTGIWWNVSGWEKTATRTGSIQASGLEWDKEYRVSVREYDIAGNAASDYSSWQYFQTINSAPTKPSNIRETSVTQTSGTIAWDEAYDADGDSITYYIQYGKDWNWDGWNPTMPLSTTETSVTLSGLEEGKTYDVRVWAVDSKGASSGEVVKDKLFTTLTFRPYFDDVCISSQVDDDGDGYVHEFVLTVDIHANTQGDYYIKFYEDDVSVFGWGDDYLGKSETKSISAGETQTRNFVVPIDDFAALARRGTAEFRIELWDATADRKVESWSEDDDADLGGIRVENSEDEGSITDDLQLLYGDIVANGADWFVDTYGGKPVYGLSLGYGVDVADVLGHLLAAPSGAVSELLGFLDVDVGASVCVYVDIFDLIGITSDSSDGYASVWLGANVDVGLGLDLPSIPLDVKVSFGLSVLDVEHPLDDPNWTVFSGLSFGATAFSFQAGGFKWYAAQIDTEDGFSTSFDDFVPDKGLFSLTSPVSVNALELSFSCNLASFEVRQDVLRAAFGVAGYGAPAVFLYDMLVSAGADVVSPSATQVSNLADILGKGQDENFANPWIRDITNDVLLPEIVVLGSGQNIADNDTTPSNSDGTNFGSIVQGQAGSTKTFTVCNTGTATLTLGTVSVPVGFTLLEPPASSLDAGESDTFTIQLNSTTMGTKSGNVSFSTNDSDESPFNFSITGGVTEEQLPEIAVDGNGRNIADNDTTSESSDGTDFGSVVQGQTGIERTFTVRNTGDAVLILGSVSLPTGYALVEGLDNQIAAGGSDTFTVRLESDNVGTKQGEINFATNDPDEHPFNFSITGNVTEVNPAEATITGTISYSGGYAGPIYVALFEADGWMESEPVAVTGIAGAGEYTLPLDGVAPGTYILGAYMDVDGNGELNWAGEEPRGIYGGAAEPGEIVIIEEGGSIENVDVTLVDRDNTFPMLRPVTHTANTITFTFNEVMAPTYSVNWDTPLSATTDISWNDERKAITFTFEDNLPVGEILWELNPDGENYFFADFSGTQAVRQFGSVLVEATGPTTAVAALDITAPGATTYVFTAEFWDDTELDLDSIGDGDFRVVAPGGTEYIPSMLGGYFINGIPATYVWDAPYEFTAPGGIWDSSDNGTYAIWIEPNQIFDADGNAIAAQQLAEFTVNISNPGSISGLLWNDIDRDGQKDDFEPVLDDRTVYLDANDNGQFDFGEASVQTAADGTYTLVNLAEGSYIVRQVLPAGWAGNWPAGDGSYDVSINEANGYHSANNNFASYMAANFEYHFEIARCRYGDGQQLNEGRMILEVDGLGNKSIDNVLISMPDGSTHWEQSLGLPAGENYTYQIDPDDGYTPAALLAMFPTGVYQINLTYADNSTSAVQFYRSSGAFPDWPTITNPLDGDVGVTDPPVLTWTPNQNDWMELIDETGGETLLVFGGDTGRTDSGSYAVPAGTLQPGHDYLLVLDRNEWGETFLGSITAVRFRTDGQPTLALDDVTMSHNEHVREIILPATDADGQVVVYTAQAISPVDSAYELKTQLGLVSYLPQYNNQFQLNEKWMQSGTGVYYYILPSGEVHQYNVGLVGQVEADCYADPQAWIDADCKVIPGLDQFVSVNGNVLSIQPNLSFVGTFDVRVTATDNTTSPVTDTFSVTVVNDPPTWTDLPGDQLMSHNDDTLTVPLAATDADGDTITYTAVVNTSADAYTLKTELGLAIYLPQYNNQFQLNEKWMQSGTGVYYYILPSGEIHQYNVGLVGQVAPSYHADPQTLIDLGPMSTPDVQLTIANGQLTIDPPADFEGTFHVDVTAGDGVATAIGSFSVTVVNDPPTWTDLPGDQLMSHNDDTLTVPLAATDADGDTITYTAVVNTSADAYTLKTELGLAIYLPQYNNQFQLNEKWMQSGTGVYYYILPSGEVYQYNVGLVGQVAPSYHADPWTLINQPTYIVPAGVTCTINASQLTINLPSGLTGTFEIELTATDGLETIIKTFLITCQ